MCQGSGSIEKSILDRGKSVNSMCRDPGKCDFFQSRGRACEAEGREEGPAVTARACWPREGPRP